MDILSKQPTTVDLSAMERDSETTHFVFDTTNLFLCGSPAGFFLLLKKAALLPRKDRKHWSPNGEDWVPAISESQNTYGCLAVDNIYNIVNPYDPVAYRLNATFDAAYAASLKPAYVPSSYSSWFSLEKLLEGTRPRPQDNRTRQRQRSNGMLRALSSKHTTSRERKLQRSVHIYSTITDRSTTYYDMVEARLRYNI